MGIEEVFLDPAIHFDTNSDSTSRVDVDPDAEWHVVDVMYTKSSTSGLPPPPLFCFSPLRPNPKKNMVYGTL